MSEKPDSAFAIVKCSHCKVVLSSEDFEKHKCKLQLESQKTIPVAYFMDTSYGGNKLMTGWGIDGTLYTFEVVPRKSIPITIPLADGKKHPFRTDDKEPVPRIEPINRGSRFRHSACATDASEAINQAPSTLSLSLQQEEAYIEVPHL